MIPLFFSDFKRFVKSEQFKGDALHPVLYFETEDAITFYKPVGGFIYTTVIIKESKPEDMDLNNVKMEFNAVELPKKLNTNTIINLQGSIN